MAIAVSPPVALPPGDSAAGPRAIAMPWLSQSPSPVVRFADPQPGPDELLAIALGLVSRATSWPGMARPTQRRWELMAASSTVEAWVIAWPPGGAIELHDHGRSRGAVVVAAGELVESSVVRRGSRDVTLRTTTIPTGGSIGFRENHVHDIVNLGSSPAISVHVYSPRLTSMTYYRVAEGALEAGATVRYLDGAAVP